MTSARKGTKGSSRRERILVVAAELFATRGYLETNVADVGAGAGVSGTAIYRYFDNKGDLLAAIFDSVHEKFLDGGNRIVESGDPPEAMLERLVEFHVEMAFDLQKLSSFYHYSRQHVSEDALKRLDASELMYRDHWLRVLTRVRTSESLDELRALISGALGLISEVARDEMRLPRDVLEPWLIGMALAVVNATPMPRK